MIPQLLAAFGLIWTTVVEEDLSKSATLTKNEFFEIQRDRKKANYTARLSSNGILVTSFDSGKSETSKLDESLFRAIEVMSARIHDMPTEIKYSKSNCDVRIFPASKYRITLGFGAEIQTKNWDQECRGFVEDFRYNNFIEMVEAFLNIQPAKEPWKRAGEKK